MNNVPFNINQLTGKGAAKGAGKAAGLGNKLGQLKAGKNSEFAKLMGMQLDGELKGMGKNNLLAAKLKSLNGKIPTKLSGKLGANGELSGMMKELSSLLSRPEFAGQKDSIKLKQLMGRLQAGDESVVPELTKAVGKLAGRIGDGSETGKLANLTAKSTALGKDLQAQSSLQGKSQVGIQANGQESKFGKETTMFNERPIDSGVQVGNFKMPISKQGKNGLEAGIKQNSLGQEVNHSQLMQKNSLANAGQVHQYGKKQSMIGGNMISPFKSMKGGANNLKMIDKAEMNTAEAISNSFSGAEAAEAKLANLTLLNGGAKDSGSEGMGQAQKVLNLNNINASNTNELISKISDYIQQSSVGNKENLELLVKHDDLGAFKINVTKAGKGGNVNIELMTAEDKGQQFFAANESALMKSLGKAGVQVGEMKLVSMQSMNNSFVGGMDKGDSLQSNLEQFNSRGEGRFSQQQRQDGRQQDSQRRRALWEEYQQRANA